MASKAAFPERRPAGATRGQTQPVRVMIVDDSITARTVLSRTINGEADLEIVASANTAEQALATLDKIEVDLILLDLEMPGMGGLEALPKILEKGDGAQILVVSALTVEGAEHTLEALSMGAADTLPKPASGKFDRDYRQSLLERVRALGVARVRRARPTPAQPKCPANTRKVAKAKKRVIGIGASTGGIHALCVLLRTLPHSIDAPIIIAQHLPGSFMPVFARQLEMAAERPAVIAAKGMPLLPGRIHVASAEGHLLLCKSGEKITLDIAKFATPSGCTPSVDPTFASMAECFGPHALGIVLSGMGRDGAEGAAEIVKEGGEVLAQDQQSSAVWGMPRAVWEAGTASAIMPPEEIAHMVAQMMDATAWK